MTFSTFSTTYNKQEKLWYGLDIPPIYNTEINFAHALLHSMTIYGPKVAQISDDSGIQMTFDEMKTKTIRAAQNLQSRGYKQGQLFVIVAKNSHNVAPIYFALIAMGVTVSCLDANYGEKGNLNLLKVLNPALLFCDADCYDYVKKCLNQLGNTAKIFTFDGTAGCSEPIENLFKETHMENQFVPAKVDAQNDMVSVICSSGSTGCAKGIRMSHKTLLSAITKFDLFNPSDVMLIYSPLFWSSGVNHLTTGTMFGVTRIITRESFSPENAFRMIKKYKATYTFTVPFQLLQMLKHDQIHEADLSSIRIILVGGNRIPADLKAECCKHMPNTSFVSTYGLAELATCLTFDYPQTNDKQTDGRLVRSICAKVVDKDGNRCGVNEDGEICMKPDYTVLGYFRNPEATKEFIDDEGFLCSGDIGKFDEDGNLYITGRAKEFLRYGSTTIIPPEMEEFLTKSSSIVSACVVGVPHSMGDLPTAFIVRAPGSNISEKEVFDMVSDEFLDDHRLRGGVYFIDSLPTLPSGKVHRQKVKEMAIERYNATKSQ